MYITSLKIVSGGQSGVDRAALDFAIGCSYLYGGWCPQGGLAEDYPTPPGVLKDYPALQESTTRDYTERTELNVQDSDATLIIAPHLTAATTGGTGMTQHFAKQHKKPFFVACLNDNDCYEKARGWLQQHMHGHGGLFTLNVAGPRLSKSPGIYQESLVLLKNLLTEKNMQEHDSK